VEFGGGSLLTMLARPPRGVAGPRPGRHALCRQTPLSDGLKSLVRVTLLLAPILVSLGFFLSVLSPTAERPNGLINLIYLAAILLAVGVVTLGIGLFQA
jgi:hypothetical protein